ncbi:serine/threonine protein kinase [Enterobacteriaceae bacterium 4M9]|nr:serine/threonine protein kinase [Enterobacteriaceae bacterium 4M9]
MVSTCTSFSTLSPGCRALALAPGHSLGGLVIEQVIGEGGFSLVYRAFDPQYQRAVALKEYLPTTLASRNGNGEVVPRSELLAPTFLTGRQQFCHEAKTMAQLSHPAIPALLRFWQQSNSAYICMPLYCGQNMKKTWAGRPEAVSMKWLSAWLAPLLDAVATVHRQGYLHLDIAWDNIVLESATWPVLLDFGSARAADADGAARKALVLKPGFSPPELYCHRNGERVGPWSDIYALGALICALVSGELPPVSLTRCIEERYQPLAQRALPGYPRAFLQATDQALALKVADRPQSVEEFALLLGLELSVQTTAHHSVVATLR